jgi:hypothetical protein
MKTLTRKQVIDLGASKYQAELVTKGLQPVQKQGRAYVFDLFAVSDRCRELINNGRQKASTCEALTALRWEILRFAGAVQDASFGMSVLEQIEYAEGLGDRAEALLAEARAQKQQIKRRRKMVTIEDWKHVRA